ncbi:N-acetylmuramoyl-L-alanine amidase [Kitasatospora camelliae]|uniref:N-acetylmuramoyl-L-alanine amidase n=1 Tax=Kitasatospora camelliae TaxID=3156397 RepID=A0AAU8JSW7_9ACTN
MTGTTSDTPAFPEPPRRPARTRVVIAAALVLPLGLAGWFGWRAVSGGSGPDARTPAPTASTASRDSLITDANSDPLGTSPAPSGTAAPSPSAGTGGAAPAASNQLAGRTVLLDPGHNSGNAQHTKEIGRQVDIGNARKECDATGTSTNAGYSEAEYTLDVVRRARAILQSRGARVVLTQDGDRPWGPCIDERARIGNDARADAAVSVHGDGAPAGATGFHVIMPARVTAGLADTSKIVEPSQRLGLLLRDRFKEATGEPFADYIGKQGLDTRSDLGGLNLSKVPKVFIECGNMRNADDARRMTDAEWRQRAALGIADALTAFLTT